MASIVDIPPLLLGIRFLLKAYAAKQAAPDVMIVSALAPLGSIGFTPLFPVSGTAVGIVDVLPQAVSSYKNI